MKEEPREFTDLNQNYFRFYNKNSNLLNFEKLTSRGITEWLSQLKDDNEKEYKLMKGKYIDRLKIPREHLHADHRKIFSLFY